MISESNGGSDAPAVRTMRLALLQVKMLGLRVREREDRISTERRRRGVAPACPVLDFADARVRLRP